MSAGSDEIELTDAADTYGRRRTVELHRATPAGREALS